MTGLGALTALSFNYTEGVGDVWRHSAFHVEGLHDASMRILLGGLTEAGQHHDTSPIGVVVQGQRGAGKTHLLGWLRERTQADGGYFVLVGLLDAKGFWDSTVVSILDSLSRETADGDNQLKLFLARLAAKVDVPRMARRAITGRKAVTREELDAFIGGLRRFDNQVGRESQDTARALVLLASEDLGMQDIGEAFLFSVPEEEKGERARWGIRQVHRTPQEIVRDISRLLALTGPTVIAVDQIDALIAQSFASTDLTVDNPSDVLMIEQIAGGLMALREVTRRTLTIVSCIPSTWTLIEKVATDTVQDRFRQATPLMTIPDAETARRLVARRFEIQYGAAGVKPPYPTWPVSPAAFESAPGFTPRQLLITIDEHIRSCLVNGEVREMERFTRAPTTTAAGGGTGITVAGGASDTTVPVGVPPLSGASHSSVPALLGGELDALDARFAKLLETGSPVVINQENEDVLMPALLAAGLSAWIAEQGEEGREFSRDSPPSSKPPLHARLRRTLDEATEDEVHWGFRAITAENAIAALNRIRKASVAAGLDVAVPKRRLFLLRNEGWSEGARTQEVIAAFKRAGGRVLGWSDGDLRVLAALRDLLAENPPHLTAWLAARRHTDHVGFLKEALSAASGTTPSAPSEADAASVPGVPVVRSPVVKVGAECSVGDAVGPRVVLGRAVGGGGPVEVGLEALRKHAAIFAGSGSGKTVLIRRLVEECALHGVSAIVLDPNNDLARLGEPWPEVPAGWGDGDARKAEEYLAGTEVVVWTPRRAGGRPLSFQPLPDFASVADDPDEFAEAVEAAVESIAPRVKLNAATPKAQRGQAVLRKAVEHFGRRGGRGLRGLIGLLADLPDGVSELASAQRVAADLAESLTAAMDNDPLFGGSGEPVDPGLLLTPSPGRRARVSVISLVGLPGDEQRQSFVNQLQMALFAWIKKHPAGDRPLGGLFVMDEAQTFAPATGVTTCTRSTLALASQARKYGLGLVFATQAPKGLHNQIPGNAATQFFGLLNAPAQINTAKEMAQAKGGSAPEISKLSSGEFYVALEGTAFVRTRVPMCLSHHPKAPLTTEEVIARASDSGLRRDG